MSAHQSTQWFWSDWAGDPCVRRLTTAERGLWIDLLCLAAVGNPTGYVCDYRGNPLSNEEIARFTNASPTEVESLIVGILEKGAASRDKRGKLFFRRMINDGTAPKRLRGKAWQDLREAVFKRDGYACVYCGAKEDLECDHVIPISRHGSNKASNLATACARCNNEKRDRRPEEWLQ